MTKNSEKQRLDLLLLERGLASTRTKAQELVATGKVRVDGKIVEQPGVKISATAEIFLTEAEHPYVSRGGLKLAAALKEFGSEVQGLRVLDVGQSAGGFTDCLLRAGAAEVVGVDVGTAQLAPSLRQDPRVRALEKLDIRQAQPEDLGAPFSFFVADLSFISATLALPAITRFLEKTAEGIILVKPQFELDPEAIGSGGIVRDAALREKALARVVDSATQLRFTVAGSIPCPVQGGDGNQEYLVHLRWRS